jgi:hypothetical protein
MAQNLAKSTKFSIRRMSGNTFFSAWRTAARTAAANFGKDETERGARIAEYSKYSYSRQKPSFRRDRKQKQYRKLATSKRATTQITNLYLGFLRDHRLYQTPMEITSQYQSVRFLRQTTGTSIINKFLNSLLCLRQAPGLILPPDYLLRPSMIVITGNYR